MGYTDLSVQEKGAWKHIGRDLRKNGQVGTDVFHNMVMPMFPKGMHDLRGFALTVLAGCPGAPGQKRECLWNLGPPRRIIERCVAAFSSC